MAEPAAAAPEPTEGGSYTRDPAAGALVRTEHTEPAPPRDKRAEAPAQVPANPEA